jgi:autotransporter-associated beta strand protein
MLSDSYFRRRYLFAVFTTAFACATGALAQLPAFPGAEGLGRFATGARGGTVYHVTNTNDSGAGSFRDAVSVSGRTVVFDIGGIIDYKAPRYAPKANITIAGQTAPGDGIEIYGNGLSFSGSHNNVVRFLRVREGINGDSGTDAMGIANGHDMIFDHLSISWGRDETFSINGSGAVTNITIQSCIISQGLQTHSAGGLIQTDGGVSILRCLYIDNDTRNPKVKFANEFVNNVVANWETIGYNMGGDSAGDSYANAFNNYFIRGPFSSTSAFGGGNANFHIYATNNWYDGNRDGILNGSDLSASAYGTGAAQPDFQAAPFPQYPITNAVPPLTALKLAISDVGTSQRRDSVDERLMYELQTWGTVGQTISSEFAVPMSGPGIIRNGPNPTDTDQDGMPDYWENGTGSNPNSADNNAASPSGSGYTRLEDYLNWLAEPHGIALTNASVDIELRQFTRGFTNWSPVFSVANATNGAVSLTAGGMRAHFTPTTGFTGPARFNFTVSDVNGSTITRTFNLFFTPTPPVPATNLVWRGDAIANNWSVVGDLNWFDSYSLLYPFLNGNTVTFDDTGFNSPNVNLIGTISPAAVNVNASQNYALGGSGSISGVAQLLKSGTGIFRLNNTNSFSGGTTVSNGTLLVNGALTQSAITARSGGAVGGKGVLGGGITVESGVTLVPGDGIGAAGTLTISNSLSEAGGVTNRFDFSDDPTGTIKTNDVIRVIGNLTLSGTNIVKVSLLDGLPGNGIYTLFTYTGSLVGGLSNLKVVGVGGTLTNPPGAIAIILNATRAPATLLWTGNGGNNFWDTGTNVCWLNDGVADRFYFFDDVEFDTSSSNQTATLVGDLTPNSLLVNATNNYTFTGTGKITGSTGLVKTNSGTLTIATTNDYTGPTVIVGGVLSVNKIANGGTASGFGSASSDPTNLAITNATLRYTGGSVTIDRGATLGGNATLELTSGTLTANGIFTGSGALVKSGSATMIITTNNTHSGGTIISNGTVNLTTTAARDSGLGSGTCTLAGGTLQLYGYAGSTTPDYGTFSRPIFVAAGTTNTLLTPPRCTMSFPLTGSGTVNLTVDYVRDALSGNWSAFAGTINVTGRIAASEFRVANTAGYGNCTVNITDNVIITRNGSATTINIGALGGTTGSAVGPGNSSSSGSSYNIGGNNADATFAGTIKSDGVNPFTKTGTGRWTLTGANTWNGGLTINGGLVLANNASGSATGTGAVVVNTNGALGGTGTISSAITVNAGGVISPGSNGVGTVTMTGGLTLNSGAILNIEIGSTNDKVAVTGALALNGVINVTNLAGFNVGTFPIITYSGALSGVLPTIGSKPDGYFVRVNTNTAGQVRLAVQVETPPVFGNIVITNGNAIFSGIGGPTNVPYYVLSSTNLTLPRTNWLRLATNQLSGIGGFIFTNVLDSNAPQSFYLLQLP